MTDLLQNHLTQIARQQIPDNDPAHDIHHTLRVLANALNIAAAENADLDVIVPAALFHDVITYPKNDPRSTHAQEESAQVARQILKKIDAFPSAKIELVMEAIRLCSFSKGITPDHLEAKVLQDADGLEATGAISIMRTYASTGQMSRPFYHPQDPFAQHRDVDAKSYALDLFYERLLKVEERMHTKSARAIARRRTKFLHQFLDEFKVELEGK